MSKPIVAVVGRPNVGKSTFFNKVVEWNGIYFALIDTGGIEPDSEDVILSQMREQAQIAMDMADVILFMVDGRDGMTHADQEVGNMLRRTGKKVILLVNKIDNPRNLPADFYDFYELGIGEPIAISAANMLNFGDVLDEIVESFPDGAGDDEEDSIKVAVIGSGPSGLTCAGDLAKLGYEVTIFEALHEPGGVLTYGIPEFRLPKQGVVQPEIENVKKLGVDIETNVIIGKFVTVDELMDEEGYKAVFIGSGAGLPRFMGIPGENANGVFSANEYLTRSNLMKAFRDDYDTPIAAGKKVAVVGGGNVAMDAARTALRLGAEVHIVYRRSEAELPARAEEVHHAKEEGIIFNLLTNPTEILTDEKGWVKGMTVRKMELGEPDASGRRRPVEIEGSDYTIDVDTVIMALGTSPNPLISSTTGGLEINKHRCIVADEANGQTSREGVFAGGDAVTGAATVILAMEAGKAGARGIHEYLSGKKAE